MIKGHNAQPQVTDTQYVNVSSVAGHHCICAYLAVAAADLELELEHGVETHITSLAAADGLCVLDLAATQHVVQASQHVLRHVQATCRLGHTTLWEGRARWQWCVHCQQGRLSVVVAAALDTLALATCMWLWLM